MVDAAAQLRRILQLIPRCADDHSHGVAEMAALAEVDEGTLRRDLLALAERFADPGGFVQGIEIYLEGEAFSVRSDHFLRPMRLTRPELAALDLGLALLRSERTPDEHRLLESARARLQRAMAFLPAEEETSLTHHAEYGGEAEVGLLRSIREGLRQKRKLKLLYQKGEEERASRRVISPLGLVHSSGRWYLVARGERGDGIRVFRVDRIEEVEVSDAKAESMAGYDPAAVFAGGKAFVAEGAGRLVVRYGARIARWIAEREGMVPAADGSVTVEHPLADEEWAVGHVLQYGPDAEVLAPASVREKVVAKLKRMGTSNILDHEQSEVTDGKAAQ